MSLHEIILKLKKADKVYFACIPNFDEHYFTSRESFEIIKELLSFQCSDVYQFVKDLYNWLERKTNKKNCFSIVSPPNAGKNYFFDAVIHLMCNNGQIANFNKHISFPLMDCVNRRILVWNEPHCETSAYEDIKLLFGGDSMKVRVKYKDDACVERTPVLLLANYELFPKDEAFNTRMFRYYWKPFPLLKKYKKYLNPFAIIKLFQHFHLIDEEG